MSKKMEDKSTGYIIPESILSDLCSRFIINVPEEERNDLIRIFFQIEIAHWFYLDFYCESNFSTSSSGSSSSSSPSSSSSSSSSSDDNDDDNETNLVRQKPFSTHQLKPCSIRTFAENIFRHCPFLVQHSSQLDEILSKWRTFKHAVPTNGAIILDESMKYVLLVQGFWAKASWGFPKGKVFEEETEAKCAIREVLEETGYDISKKLVDDEYLQININDQTIRLYIITDVSKSIKFEPKTRREIKEVRWFPIDELPVHRKDNRSKHKLGYSPNSFFMVIPFVKSLKKWISVKKGQMSGELVNGKIVNKSLNLSQRPDKATIKHRRHNSHSLHNNTSSYYNYSSSQHHSYSSNNFTSLNTGKYKIISKSNESISSLNTSAATKKSANNAFLKHFTAQSPSSESAKQQQTVQLQKLQQSEVNDLLCLKQSALAKKTQKFKFENKQTPTKQVTQNKPQPQQQQQQQQQRVSPMKHSASYNFGFNMTNSSRGVSYNGNSNMSSGGGFVSSKVKKHLEFNGPECWINFKFDYDQIIENLPPVIDL